ncbi:MAG: fahA [Marmoricola sp.]|nr:fahA [Marmoricola sp.]
MTAPPGSARCWVPGAAGSAYDVDNLPYAAFSTPGTLPRVGVRIGDHVVDLPAVGEAPALAQPSLDAFLALGRETWQATRAWVVDLLTDEVHRDLVEPALVPLAQVTTHLPFTVADYVDFYCSLAHATNVGRIFRPDGEALSPAWRHLPIGYHGRAGTVVVSGTDVRRPQGQRRGPSGTPTFGPTQRLDLEAEVGFVVGTGSTHGEPVPTSAYADHVFGVALVNDWSARDVQAWEYVPLGPFLGKSFATSVSAWVTPLEALAAARVPLPGQDPAPLPYLAVEEPAGLDLELEVVVNGEVLSRPPYAATYWSPAQMLAHLTVNGASLRTGDLFASGTVSGDRPDQRGSLLELSWGGQEPLPGGRTFLEDGDTVTVRATAPGALGGRIALGEVTGTVLPALT